METHSDMVEIFIFISKQIAKNVRTTFILSRRVTVYSVRIMSCPQKLKLTRHRLKNSPDSSFIIILNTLLSCPDDILCCPDELTHCPGKILMCSDKINVIHTSFKNVAWTTFQISRPNKCCPDRIKVSRASCEFVRLRYRVNRAICKPVRTK